MFLLHEPEGSIEIASRGLICIVLKIPRAKPEGLSTMHINPRDAILMLPKGSCSRNIVSWFTIQTQLSIIKIMLHLILTFKKQQINLKKFRQIDRKLRALIFI